jgi:hypothetical protein
MVLSPWAAAAIVQRDGGSREGGGGWDGCEGIA